MATQRIERLRSSLLDIQPEVCAERARYYTESMKETEAQPMILRRAKALAHTLRHMTIYVQDGELIVGNQASKPKAAPIFPEYAIDWVEKELDDFDKRPSDRFTISEEVKQELKDTLPHWEGKTNIDRVKAIAPEILFKLEESGVMSDAWVLEGGFGTLIPDYETLFQIGLNGYLDRLRDHLSSLDLLNHDDVKKINFLQAAVVVVEAILEFSKRYSTELSKLAQNETDSGRRAELKAMAEICSSVPASPPKTFWEALQFLWMVHLCIQIEGNGHSISIGRFDHYLYPFYRKDVEAGRLSRESALELVEAFFIKCNELNKIRKWSHTQFLRGYPLFQSLTLGGQTEYELDATNELSWIVLDATAELRLFAPSVSIRYHNKLPDDFLIRCVEVMNIHRGGMPAMYNDNCIIPALLYEGVTAEDVYNYALVGCAESSIPGKWGFSAVKGCHFNMAKILELALYGGVDPKTGERLCGSDRDLGSFTSFDEVMEAFISQLQFVLSHGAMLDNLNDLTHEELVPNAFVSVVIRDCVERGKSLDEGGAVYDISGAPVQGIVTAADSLAAIKKAVFEEKRITGAQLKHALETDFEDLGSEPSGPEIRQMLRNEVPKYGNDDNYVDLIAVDLMKSYAGLYEQYKCSVFGRGPIGGNYRVSTSGATAYVAFGTMVGATPDGRKAGAPLNNGVSPSNGAEINGPTAACQSVAKLPYIHMGAGNLFNLKMNPAMFENRGGCEKLASLIRSFCDLGGYHMQFNIVDADTLKNAKKHPEEYRDLMVRVAGYSAYFTTIDAALQDDIIARAEFTL